jgi:hypothetical protein
MYFSAFSVYVLLVRLDTIVLVFSLCSLCFDCRREIHLVRTYSLERMIFLVQYIIL